MSKPDEPMKPAHRDRRTAKSALPTRTQRRVEKHLSNVKRRRQDKSEAA